MGKITLKLSEEESERQIEELRKEKKKEKNILTLRMFGTIKQQIE